MKKTGIDISHHQTNIDWDAVASDNIEFALLRTGYLRTQDREFLNHVEGCRDVGIDVIGVYHFSYALNESDAIDEANLAVKLVKEAGLPDTTVIYYDLEGYSVDYAKKKGVIIDKDKCMAFTKAFCERVIELGYPAGVYFNMHYYRNMYTEEFLNGYVKWLADWSGEPDIDVVLHQFTGHGTVDGINGDVDVNYIYTEDNSYEEEDEEDSIEKVVKEVFDGVWGDGEIRKESMEEAGVNYELVQELVNKVDKIALEVIDGEHGNGEDRKIKMAELGVNYDLVQHVVNLYME